MRPISLKNRGIIDSDPYYRICARHNRECSGRITIEHAMIYGGKQIDELWNFIPLCWYHHLGLGMNKRVNEVIAAGRTTQEDRLKYDRIKWSKYLG